MKTQFVTNSKGQNVAVLIPISDYSKILDELDELESIRAYDKIKSKSKRQFTPAEKVFKRIESNRKP